MWPPSKHSSEKESYAMDTWVNAALFFKKNSYGTDVYIYVDGSAKLNSQVKNHYIVSANYGNTPKVMIGSLSGYSFMKGFIYGLVYSPYDAQGYFNYI